MISRPEAITLLKKYIHSSHNLKRSFANEAILKKLAIRLNKNEDLWGLTGLLHNIDYEYTEENPEERGNLSEKILSDLLPESGVNAIKGNNYLYTDYMPLTSLDKGLIASSEITELIFEAVKYCYNKNEKEIDFIFLYTKYNDEKFATKIKRKKIKMIVDLGIQEEEFLKIALKSIIEIKDQLEI